MTLFLLHTPTTTHFTKLTTTITISCTSSKPPHKKPRVRDIVIDFGKHKGKPLGSLPSTYLKWVCSNLRAGDSLHWAELADQVLQDPIYKERIEWELAENLLTGNVNRNSESSESVVSGLVEVSERFGWDNEDKVGWSKVDFQLLGTSNGGRIPRKVEGRMGNEELKVVGEVERRVVLSESDKRRRERRMRVRGKMGIRDKGRGSFGNGEKSGEEDTSIIRDKMGIGDKGKGSFGNGNKSGDGGCSSGQDRTVEIKSEERRRLRVIRDKMGIRDSGEGSFGNEKKSNGDGFGGSGEDPTVESKSEDRRMRMVRDKMGIRDHSRGIFGIKEKSGDEDWSVEIKREVRQDSMGIKGNVKGSFGNGGKSGDGDDDQHRTAVIKSPFPGREALIKKVLRSRRFL